jgi:SAM-dependent methyltransferase
VSQKLFYNRQYLETDYASGIEERQETSALQALVKSYDLKDKRVLEIGCGRGAFQRIVEKWVGVDLAFSAGSYLRKPFIAASAEALPFKENSFDGTWSITVLEHSPHPEKSLEEITRVLKPGGVAYLAPAWHCRPWAAQGYEVRPWSDFDWKGKLIKVSIPLRNAIWFRAIYTIPMRIWRESLFLLKRKKPMHFRYRELKANHETYWCADSDACNSMDPHEMLLWFRSRGWDSPSHPTWASRFLVRHGAIILQKPGMLIKQKILASNPSFLEPHAEKSPIRPLRLKRLLLSLFEVIAGLGYFAEIIYQDVWQIFHRNGDQRKLNHLDIEPTNICNANCVFCAYQYQEGETYTKIDLQFVGKLLDSFCTAGGGDIGLTPIVGDPLVSRDIERLVSMCRSRNEIKRIGLTTNGILLTREKFIRLRDAGVSDVVISMTYPDEKEYEKIFRSKQFHRLMSNLNELLLLDRGQVEISLAIRTPKLFWKGHPLFKRAKLMGWRLSRNFYFDDWSGSVKDGLEEYGLLRRPLRGQYLPCTMLQSGPHALASGRITACGCRDLEGKSELADKMIFNPYYESGDLRKVYYETIDPLRERFSHGTQPQICATCRHYNPEFRFASTRDWINQVWADAKAAARFMLQFRT